MLNKCFLMGRLTKEPELKTTQNGKFVTTFVLAVDRTKDKTDFFTCTAWDKTAEFIKQYCGKGQLIVVDGSLRTREWTDKSGSNRIAWEVQVFNAYFAERKKEPNISAADFTDLDDEDVPF